MSDAKKLAIIFDLLRHMGYVNPKADSGIENWFKDSEKDDKAVGMKTTSTDMFIIGYLHFFPTATIGKQQLLDGDFKTPQDLADNAP
jgi:hypothetical protein